MSRKLYRSDVAPPERLKAKGLERAVDVHGDDAGLADVGTLFGVLFQAELEAWAASRTPAPEPNEPKQRRYLGRGGKHTETRARKRRRVLRETEET